MQQFLKFLFLTLFIISCQSQKREVDQPKNKHFEIVPVSEEDNVVGFACYEGGNATTIVENYGSVLKSKNYGAIKNKLYSSAAEDRFLATLICTYLSQKTLITLSEKDLKRMRINSNSNDSIATCSGCTSNEKYAIKELLNNQEHFFAQETKGWFDEIMKE